MSGDLRLLSTNIWSPLWPTFFLNGHFFWRLRPPPKKVLSLVWHYTVFDSKAPVLEIWAVWCTSSLPLLPGSFWPRMVALHYHTNDYCMRKTLIVIYWISLACILNLISLKKKQEFFQLVVVSTIVSVYHLDFNEMLGEKAKWELHKDDVYCFEQILEAALHKTAALWPFTSHIANHPSKMSKTWLTLSMNSFTFISSVQILDAI